MTLEEAKILSIKKWQYVLDHFDEIDGDDITLYNIIKDAEKKYGLDNLLYGCPYCKLFVKFSIVQITPGGRKAEINYAESCKGCPISLPEDYLNADKMLHCAHPDHEWCIMDGEQTRESVENLLNIIKNS